MIFKLKNVYRPCFYWAFRFERDLSINFNGLFKKNIHKKVVVKIYSAGSLSISNK